MISPSRKTKLNPRQARQKWEEFFSTFMSNAEVDVNEPEEKRIKRRKRLEANPEEWFAYYFHRYCRCSPADFHRKATRRLLKNPNCYEVRAWSRELAKSARSMMEICYLALTGQVRNVLLVSNSYDNACRLLLPFKNQLENDLRIQMDYGPQPIEGKWEDGEFTARCGCAFRAIGAGQSPRGTRNGETRPDFILIDDLDTDEACRNPDRIKQTWEHYFTMEKANKDGNTGEWALQDAMKDIDAKTETAPLTEAAKENVQHLTPGRKKSKACPLIDYLPEDSGEAVISYIRSYITTHQSAMLQALPYFVLKEMPLRLPLLNRVEYATVMTRQFPDVSELLSEHSLRQAVGKLAGTETQLLDKDSKKQICRYIESDANQRILEQLRNDIGKII